MSKYTRGKWTENDRVITASDEKGKWIRNVADILCCEDEDEKKANARLIAAAPEMYELLQMFCAIDDVMGEAAISQKVHHFIKLLELMVGTAGLAKELLARIDGGEAEA